MLRFRAVDSSISRGATPPSQLDEQSLPVAILIAKIAAMAHRKFLIVGNGVAGVTAAMTLRAREPLAEITMISGESRYFFSRTAMMYALMGHMDLPQLEPYERSVWTRQNIHLVHDWVCDIDVSRGLVTTRSSRTFAFDRLLLATGSSPRKPDWPGLSEVKSGLVNFVTQQDLNQCEQLLPKTRAATVVGGGLIGVELVECLAHHKIPVRFLVREPHFYQTALNKAEAAIVESHLRHRGVDLQTNETVAKVAVSATGQVSEIETLSGKRFACDFLGVTIGVEPAINWLRNVATPPELGRGIKVDASFQTSLNSIYAAGDCAELSASGAPAFVEQLWYSAKRQGEIAAHSMLGDKSNYNRPIFYNSSKFFEIEFTCAGLSHPGPQGREYFSAVPGRPASVRLIEQDGLFAGISLLGSRWRHELFERWIAERRSVSLVVEHLEQAQFDVEFGRVPMAAVRRDLAAQIQQIQGQLAVV